MTTTPPHRILSTFARTTWAWSARSLAILAAVFGSVVLGAGTASALFRTDPVPAL